MDDGDQHDEIERLEAQIEELADKIENCRKFILAARIAMASGGALLVALLFGAIRFDPQLLMVTVAALLGGIVVWGSNDSTAKETAHELAVVEASRAALIGQIHFRVVAGGETLH